MASRERSFWGWGYADRFPSDDVRKMLAAQIGALLGAEPTLRPLPAESSIRLTAPRCMPPAQLGAIASVDPRERIAHTYGRSFRDLVRGFQGDFSCAPDWVAYPTSEANTPADVAASIYRALGIDTTTRLLDPENRPHFVLQDGRVIPGLFA